METKVFRPPYINPNNRKRFHDGGLVINFDIQGIEEATQGFKRINEIAREFITGHPTIRRGDELRIGEARWKVCRVDVSKDPPWIVCTNGAETRHFLRWGVYVGAIEHYRDGKKIEHRKRLRAIRHDADALFG